MARDWHSVRPLVELEGPFSENHPANLRDHGLEETFGGEFSFMATVRMNEVHEWSRIFDFSLEADCETITAGSVESTDTLHFSIIDSNRSVRSVSVPGGLAVGKEATFLFTVSAAGHLKLYRDGSVLAESLAGQLPAAVYRPHLTIGGHHLFSQGFRGSILAVRVWSREVTWESLPQAAGRKMPDADSATPVTPELRERLLEQGLSVRRLEELENKNVEGQTAGAPLDGLVAAIARELHTEGKPLLTSDMQDDPEKRLAPDGSYYTKSEFQRHYGGLVEWNMAVPAPRKVEEPAPLPSALLVGQLVRIIGAKENFDTPEQYRGDRYSGPQDYNGDKGQLVEFHERAGEWVVATFEANFVAVPSVYLQPLTAADIEDFDIALGPASDKDITGQSLADCLDETGHVLCRAFIAPEDLENMISAADKCAGEGMLSRLALELEPGYLGRGGEGKMLSIDFEDADTPDFVKDSSLTLMEEAISTVGTLMQPFTEEQLGFEVYSRSTTMMALPLAEGDDDEAPDLENEDAASFLSMMYRAKIMVIANAGPAVSTLILFPKSGAGTEPVLKLQPGMLAAFLLDRYKFSYRPGGKALSLLSFCLDAPLPYTVANLTGDVQVLTGTTTGPPAPKKEENHVTVVSTSVRYGFGVDEPWKLWQAYGKAAFDTMIRHPFQRWDCDMYYQEDADQTTGYSYTCHGGFTDGIEFFDCRFFDIAPAEAKSMDPTQRQVLEVSYIALAGAGFLKKKLQQKSANVACFVGLDKNEWNSIPKDLSTGLVATGSANAITSNRFNYCMNLKGASMTIDTACSASLVGTHTGKLYLMHKHFDPCEAVISCGVNLSISPWTYIGGCAAGMHSHLGRCFTYNFSADGYARGEATAACGLKNKTWDKDAGDYCLMAGSQANQDGRSASLTAPNGPSQERCSQAVMAEVGIRPPEVDTSECHGTGTSLGDPIEIGAYKKVMTRDPRFDPVVITSSKSNIGHCEGSAGISGFLKCVLLCMWGEGSPNVHMNVLNPHLDMEGFPAVITTEGVPFRAEASYNGVLSFGFGGTNACAQCWGLDTMTTRYKSGKDLMGTVIQKLKIAAAQEVQITGDDWEDWEMDGPGKDIKPGDEWEVEIDEDGEVTYMKRERESADVGMSYDISGTFNSWSYDSMDPDDTIPGLFYYILELGPAGQEDFHVVADQDPSMTFSPRVPRCSYKSMEVVGPKEADKADSWCLLGDPGDRFRIEFYKSDADAVSLTWRKER